MSLYARHTEVSVDSAVSEKGKAMTIDSILMAIRGLPVTSADSPVFISVADAKALCEAWDKRETEVEQLKQWVADHREIVEIAKEALRLEEVRP